MDNRAAYSTKYPTSFPSLKPLRPYYSSRLHAGAIVKDLTGIEVTWKHG